MSSYREESDHEYMSDYHIKNYNSSNNRDVCPSCGGEKWTNYTQKGYNNETVYFKRCDKCGYEVFC